MIKEPSNINHLWALLIVEEFVRLGIRFFFISPGSRSTPLVTAVGRHQQTRSFVHYDERGTAFAALGFSKATGKPAVWITTSGTAVANGLPAVIEAYMDGVPMILLTADRPHELRQTGANQSIQQSSIFSSYALWQTDASPPTNCIEPNYVLSTIDQAVHRALSNGMGPVHINWMFREPLVPQRTGNDFSEYLSSISDWLLKETPYTKYYQVNEIGNIDAEITSTVSDFLLTQKGVILAGRLKSIEEAVCVLKLAKALRWPVFADISSQLRLGFQGDDETLLLTPLLFSVENQKKLPVPDTVIQFGKRPTSKHILSWIKSIKPTHNVIVDDWPNRIDPLNNVTCRVESSVRSYCTSLLSNEQTPFQISPNWLQEWIDINAEALAGLENYWMQEKNLNEPAIAKIISDEIGEHDLLLIGNSMPIRDIDSFASTRGKKAHVISNRGASGIDGSIATAAGAALGGKQACTVLLGDLSLLHDLNSLALVKQVKTSFVVIVVNNDGGGIFSFLPIAGFTDVFESYFGTPHGLQFNEAAKMFGARYHKPETIEEFRSKYANAIKQSGFTLIEICTNRQENYQIHKKIERQTKIS